jgi:peptidyl-prolyl cis-trans isomerase SurA
MPYVSGLDMKKVVPITVLFCLATLAVAFNPASATAAPLPQAVQFAADLGSHLAANSDETVVEEIVARVNDAIITRSDVERSRQQVENELHQNNIPGTDPRAVEAEKNVLRDLIDQQLLVQKASDLGLSADTELVKRLDDLRKQMNLSSMEDLEKAAQQQGISYEDFKNNLRNQILTQQVISHEVGSKIQISPDQVKAYYDSHKQEFEHPEQIRLSEILISTDKPNVNKDAAPNGDQVAAAQAKAEEVFEKIKAGRDFAGLSEQYSDGSTASSGGDLGYFKRGSMSPELEGKVFAMKAGETTGITRTKQGFLILKVTEHRDAGVTPLKEVESQIQEALYVQQLQPKLREYLTSLREDAYIDIKPGYVDAAASPNQTKPVITTASATTSANNKDQGLKKKKKFGVF